MAKTNKLPPRPKGGRYTDIPGEARDVVVFVRVTAAEKIAVQRNADAAGLSVSEFVRRRSLNIPVVPPRARGDAAMLTELSAVGNNLNQLTKRVNAGDVRDIDDQLKLTLARLRKTLDVVTEAYLEE